MQCGFCVLPSFTGARYTVHASEENVCLIVIRHRERPGCGNTAGGSAWERRICRRHCNPHLRSRVHPSSRADPRPKSTVRAPNPRLRTPGLPESAPAATSKPRSTKREHFLLESPLPRYARIATTPATVRPAHGAAIVEGKRDKIGDVDNLPNSCKERIALAALQFVSS